MDALHRNVWFAGALGLSLALAGCTKTIHDGGTDVGGGASAKPKPIPGTTTAAVAALTQASDCDDLLHKIQSDVIAKIDAQAVALKKGPEYASYFGNGYGYRGGVAVGEGDFAGAPQASGGAGTGASFPSTPGAGDGSSNGGVKSPTDPSSAPTGHSETNTQVEGVDEADIVKTDESAKKLYLLHGNTLFRLTSWPPESTSIDDQTPIEGQASELFVDKGKAVVFSTLWDPGDLVPRDANGSYGYAGGYQPYYYGSPFTKITTIDVSGKSPKIERELYVEGTYLSSRRHGDTVRAIVQGGFHAPPVFSAYIEYTDPWGEPYPQDEIDRQVDAWRARVVESIEKTDIDAWVPVDRERIDGKVVKAAPRCVDFYAPPPALAGYGLTNVVSFDVADPKAQLGGAIILGNADTVYANDDTLLLAQRDWRYDYRFLDREQTVLHTFVLDGAKTKYQASGFVPGHILNQFSLDVAGDVVRIATTQNIWQDFVELVPLKSNLSDVPMAATRKTTDNRVIALQAEGQKLVRLGITEPLGLDGEQIKATRFVGDRGYVTTFRQTDPLTVVGLADPKQLAVLGEAHIPGFSEYMHPMDSGHLLTIGRNTDANGRDIGLMLQIFDVSDATMPKQVQKLGFEPSGWSEASSNHKAFTYWVPEGEKDGLLAIPYVNYSAGLQSSLQVFRVSITDGFTRLGAIDHSPYLATCYDQLGSPTSDYYVYYYCQQPEVRRGLFIEDGTTTYVYSISWAGVQAHALADLEAPLASVVLPAPDYGEHREGDAIAGGGAAGAGTVGVGKDGGFAGVSGTSGVAGSGGSEPAADGGMAMPAP